MPTTLGLLLLVAQAGAPGAAADRPATRWGDFRSEHRGLAAPGHAAFDAQGRLWISETGAGAVRAILPDGTAGARFDLVVRAGLPREPHGLAVGPDGALFVADAVEHAVLVLDAAGTLRRAIGKRGAGPGELREPRGLTLHGGRLYVADAGNHRVAVYALDGTFERALGSRGGGDGELLAPADVAVDDAGRVFVADLGNQRVVRFQPDGRHGTSWGGLGPWTGLFHAPTGIAVQGGLVLVADRDNHRVQVFDGDGRPHHEWGLHAVRPREGGGKLHYPSDVAVSPDGRRAAVVEGFENRVQVFGDEGAGVGDPPIVDRSASAHYEGGADAARNLLALIEPSVTSISIFDLAQPTPVEITRLGRPGWSAGKFLAPADVAFDADGRSVWVADPLLSRISQFALAYETGGPLRFDPFAARFVRALQLDELAGVPPAPWPPEPCALERAPDGGWLVADRANARVLVLSAEWAYQASLTGSRSPAGRLLEPAAIAVSGTRVWVADPRARTIEVYAFRADGAGSADSANGAYAHVATHALPGARGAPGRVRGLAPDGAGGAWATVEDAHALVRLDAEGRAVLTLGAPGGADGLGVREWFHPQGLARAPDGALAVVDAGNHRFQVLAPDGAFRTAWGARLFLLPILAATRPEAR